MNEWQYKFPETTRNGWLDKASLDLRGKPLESIQTDWWPGEIRHPFHHHDDYSGEPIVLPSQLFNTAPILIEWIEVKDDNDNSINKKILGALQYGAQSIILDIRRPDVSIATILQSVIRDFISVSVEFADEVQMDSKSIPEDIIVRHKEAVTNYKLHSVEKFVFDISAEGNWIQKATDLFKNILEINKRASVMSGQNILSQCILRYIPDCDYLKQIIQTRVLHLIWQEILSKYPSSSTSHPYLECHIQPGTEKDPDKYLIQASASALAASQTGVHALCIHPIRQNKVPEYYLRVNRNIHHLLNMESEMYKGVDPLAGSYVIDFYARKWSNGILANLFS
ncbi:MAG: methylmalonyl-CoA mutase family protein [Bacteroidota bacterium]|nr:methylmalonyl-CoA mutase family protein [Bacteroidota bacterium]